MRLHTLILISLLGFLLAGCSSTELVGQWTDPEYRGGAVDSMLVVGATQDKTLRRMYEDAFAQALQDRGINAVASYRVFPEADKLNPQEVNRRVEELGLRGVLTTHLVDKERVEETVAAPYPAPYYDTFAPWPSYYSSWNSYYGYGYRYGYMPPPTTRETTIYTMETSLYQAKQDELLWSARTETSTTGGASEVISEVVDKMMEQLEESGLI